MDKMKTIFITGCSSGLGRALCEEALAIGFRVIATARDSTCLPQRTENLLPLALDVNDSEQIAYAVRIASAWADGIDILVNNAGYGQMGPMMSLQPEQVVRQMETNLIAPLKLIQAVVPHMPLHAGATIVNIGSISATLTTPFAGAYCASKAALQSASDALRMELKPMGINVMTVQAGAIASEFASNANRELPELSGEYAQLSEHIRSRANASQANPTPAKSVAEAIIFELKKSTPSNLLRTGYGAMLYPLLAKLPISITDWLLCRRFGLDKPFQDN